MILFDLIDFIKRRNQKKADDYNDRSYKNFVKAQKQYQILVDEWNGQYCPISDGDCGDLCPGCVFFDKGGIIDHFKSFGNHLVYRPKCRLER